MFCADAAQLYAEAEQAADERLYDEAARLYEAATAAVHAAGERAVDVERLRQDLAQLKWGKLKKRAQEEVKLVHLQRFVHRPMRPAVG